MTEPDDRPEGEDPTGDPLEGPLSFDPAARDEPAQTPQPEPEPLEQPARPEPEDDFPRPATLQTPSRYGWLVGAVAIIVLAYITINSLSTEGTGSRGVEADLPLPPFAMPLATSDLEGDANIARRSDQGDAGEVPACTVRGPDILNICQLAEQGPVVLSFLATRGGSACKDQLDRLEKFRPRFPELRFAAVSIRGSRKDVRKLIEDRGWSFPIGYDHDGVVANLYRIAVCPTTTFAKKGGIVVKSDVGELDDAEFLRELNLLRRESRGD